VEEEEQWKEIEEMDRIYSRMDSMCGKGRNIEDTARGEQR